MHVCSTLYTMSKLEKLMIQGIRSFNPREKNIVEFYTPLTLIVGANGTGKTTVIECLKYVTTGDMPPNTRGGAFIFDPKIAKEIDVRAEVKLKFRNNNDEGITCTRSMQSSIKKVKSELKTLDSSLSKDSGDREVLITSKIADIDRDVPQHLGVSKSILDDVIFCHQDESTWPVGDPTTMKKKLDEIFASTKYNKALLGMKAAKKEIAADMKLKEQQLSMTLKEKMKKDEISTNVKDCREEIERKNNKIRLFREEIERIEGNMKLIADDLCILERLEVNHRLLKVEFDDCKKFIDGFGFPILDVIDRDCTAREIKELEAVVSGLNNSTIEGEFARLEAIRRQVLDEWNRNEIIRQKIRESEALIASLASERKNLIQILTSEFSCSETELTQKMADTFVHIETNIKHRTGELELEREKLITERNRKSEMDTMVREKRVFVEQHRDLSVDVNVELVEVPIDYDKRARIESKINGLLDEIATKQTVLGNAFKNVGSVFKKTMLAEDIEKLCKEISCNTGQDLEIEIDKRSQELAKMKCELKCAVEEDYRNKIYNEQIVASNTGLLEEMHVVLGQLHSGEKENAKNYEFTEIAKVIQASKITPECISKLKVLCKSRLFDPVDIRNKEDLTSELACCKVRIDSNRYATAIYRNFLDIGNKKSSCPLCRRGFDSTVATAFNTRLDDLLKKLEDIIKTAEMKEANLLESITVLEREGSAMERDNKARSRMTQIISELAPAREVLDDVVSRLESDISKCHSEIERLKHLQCDVEYRKARVVEMQKELDAIPDAVDGQEMKNELSLLIEQLEQARNELAIENSEVASRECMRKRIDQEKENRAIVAKRERYLNEVSSVPVYDLVALEESVRNKEMKLEKIKGKFMKSRIEAEQKVERCAQIDSTVTREDDRVLGLKSSLKDAFCGKTVRFNNLDVSVAALCDLNVYEDIRTTFVNHKNRIIEATRDLESMRHALRVIDENIKLRCAKDRIVAIENEISSFEKGKYEQIKGKHTRYEEKRVKLMGSEATLKGELKQLGNTLLMLSKDLEKYKNAGIDYLKCMLEMKALEFGSSDLEKCINVLDRAIVDFHKTKIEEVNRTLRDLWSSTYKGNDIDYIELKVESTDTRAYSYRLVMVKNGVELEMRGRSSAGQKMIASILFRIAIADSLSNGCNVLALDEPTTNLDRDNIESLAQTLSGIIKERREFQLIVITHDEDFVQLLNREGTEYFYRLRRDAKGCGYIERHSIYR